MISLSNFLSKFKSIDKNNSEKISEIIKVIESICGISLSQSEILIEKGMVRLNTSPLKRNEIFMKKEEILEVLKLVDSKIHSIL